MTLSAQNWHMANGCKWPGIPSLWDPDPSTQGVSGQVPGWPVYPKTVGRLFKTKQNKTKQTIGVECFSHSLKSVEGSRRLGSAVALLFEFPKAEEEFCEKWKSYPGPNPFLLTCPKYSCRFSTVFLDETPQRKFPIGKRLNLSGSLTIQTLPRPKPALSWGREGGWW